MGTYIEPHDKRINELIPQVDYSNDNREVRWIELIRVKKGNALNVGLLKELTEAIEEVPQKVIFISSRSKHFSTGLDRDDFSKPKKKTLRHLVRLYSVLANHKPPTACLVAGGATAGGVGLALCADAVVMTCNSWFRLPGEKVYRPLAQVLFPVVEERHDIDESEFEEWYGQTITAHELFRNGHIDSVVHSDPGTDPTAKLMQAVVDVLAQKVLLPRSDLSDRDDLRKRVSKAESWIFWFRWQLQNPDSISIPWLVFSGRFGFWISLIVILGSALALGISIGQSDLYRDSIAPIIEHYRKITDA